MTSLEKVNNKLSDKKVLKLFKEGKLTMEKKWYKSRTLQIGLLQIVVGVSTALITDITSGVVLTVSGIIAIVLRVVTRSSLIR